MGKLLSINIHEIFDFMMVIHEKYAWKAYFELNIKPKGLNFQEYHIKLALEG